MKSSIHLLNNMAIIQALGYITIVVPNSHLTMKFHLKRLPLKMYKFDNTTFDALMHDNTNNHLRSSSVIKCIIHELLHAKTKALPF